MSYAENMNVISIAAGDNNIGNVDIVSGTVTAELSATDNAVLDTIDTALDAINAKLVTGTVIGDVNLGATDNAVLDTIAAKDFATQTTLAAINAKLASGTVIGDVNLGATDNAVLDTIAAKDFATQTTLAAINTKLATGTVIGDVNLGATDNAVLDAIALAVATEGDALGDGILMQGDDGTDRTNVLVDADGHIQVDVLSGGGAGTQYTEDAAAAADPVGGALIMVRDDALSGQTTTDGDNVAARGTDKGELYVKHVDAIPVTDNGGALTIDGTVTAELSATDNAVLDTIDAVLDAINAKLVTGTVIGDVNLGATDNAVLDTIDAVLDAINAKMVTGTVIGDVNLGATDNAVLDAIAASLATLDNGTVGTVADDATTPGNPVMTGGKAVNIDGTDPTSVAEDDVAIFRTDLNRRQLVSDIHPNLGTANHEETSAQTNHEVIAAPGAGLCIYVTDIIISNGATAGSIKCVQSTGSSPVTKVPTMYFGINGGAVMNFKTPIKITAATNFGFTSTTMTTHTILINYFIAP